MLEVEGLRASRFKGQKALRVSGVTGIRAERLGTQGLAV